MAHHKSAIKRTRIAERQRLVNRQMRSKLRTLLKAVRSAENKSDAESALARVIPFLDKFANKGLIHRNKAANQKSKLTKYVNTLQ